MTKKFEANNTISCRKSKLIDENGSLVKELNSNGEEKIVFTKEEILTKAKERNKDVVLLVPQIGEQEGVCKLVEDFAKFKFDLEKEEESQKKNSKALSTKVIQLNIQTGDNDIKRKAEHATEFLKKGNRVTIEIRIMRRKDYSMIDKSVDVLKKSISYIKGEYRFDKEPTLEGNKAYAILSPIKKK